jgi:hypothetical protein
MSAKCYAPGGNCVNHGACNAADRCIATSWIDPASTPQEPAGVREALERAQKALRKLLEGAALALNSLSNPHEGVVADFLAAIHQTAAKGLLASDGVTNECDAERPIFCRADEDLAEFNAMVRANILVNDLLVAVERGVISRERVLKEFAHHPQAGAPSRSVDPTEEYMTSLEGLAASPSPEKAAEKPGVEVGSQ